MRTRTLLRLGMAAAALVPALAWAHPGHGPGGDGYSSFVAGALHPLTSVDHLAGFIAVGVLLTRLGGRYVAPVAAVLLGLLVAAGTSESDGWRFAGGFLLTSASLIAVSLAATMTATRLRRAVATATGPRSPI